MDANTPAVVSIEPVKKKRKHKANPRTHGTGGVFRVKGSRFFWISYRLNGKYVPESSGKKKKKEAKAVLKDRMAKVYGGNFLGPEIDRMTVAELFPAVLTDYRNQNQAVEFAEMRWKKHLEPFFGLVPAAQVGTDKIAAYIEKRKTKVVVKKHDKEITKKGAANATINRELALLRRTFTLAFESEPQKVVRRELQESLLRRVGQC
jgi:hypothetical protein